jgi:hypothetical protein
MALSSKQSNIKISCIVQHPNDLCGENIESIQLHCLNRGFTVEMRIFDSYSYSDDREYIISLPAFHIYIGAKYENTVYPSDSPIEIIDSYIEKYRASEEKARRRREVWKKFFELPKRVFKLVRAPVQTQAERIQYTDNLGHGVE